MWYSIVRLKVKWNQWFFFLHNALPIWEENGGLDYQLFFKAVRTFLIERSSTKIAQNSYSPFTKMTFACSESNFFQHPPSQIKQWSYNFPNYFYINSTKDIMWKRHYTLSEIHIFTCSFQCMKQSLTIYSIVEIGQSFLFISNS